MTNQELYDAIMEEIAERNKRYGSHVGYLNFTDGPVVVRNIKGYGEPAQFEVAIACHGYKPDEAEALAWEIAAATEIARALNEKKMIVEGE